MPEGERPAPRMGSEEEFLTVAEAAERFDLPARRVRHLLERSAKQGNNAPETRQKTFRTKTGERSAVAYPVAWLEALLDAEAPPEETFQRSEGEPSGNEAKQGAEPFQPSAPERSEDADWRARALVAEARAELLDRELADWKTQAAVLGEALKSAQEEARAARLRPVQALPEIPAAGLAGDTQSGSTVPGGGITSPDPGKPAPAGFWARLWRKG